MAEIRRRANAAPISNFRQGAPSSGGGGFALLAEAMQSAYRMLEPGAKQEMEALGDESAQEYIRANMGAIRPASIAGASSMGGHSGEGISPRAQAALAALQADYGKLNVISGYRDPARNAKVGGAKGSQHLHGNAFDIDVAGLSQDQRTDLIRRARAAGFEGIGVYDNSLHFDVGGDRAWGPSYKRDSLPAWAAEAVGAPIGGPRVAGASSKGAAEPPATVITAEGKTELRLFSPIAGPLLQAHNAAARAAVGMEVLNQGELALIDMSKQFELDPQGFQQAARTYVDEVIKGLPRELRADTRQSLGQYASRRFLGMMEAKQTETRQRAANANKALVDRWGDSYAEALASGDPETIAEAQAKLDGALGLRETLPGLSWTPEQSENVRIASRKQADQIMAQQRRDAQAEVKGKLNLIIGAAKDGSQSADEGILQDAKVKELFPDLWNEAAAWVIARDAMPEMWKMTPDELANDAAAKRAMPVTNDFQLDQLNVLDSMAKTQAKEFAEDPIKRAQQVLPGTITPLDPSSPEKFGSSLAQRFTEAMGLAGIDKDGQRTGRAYVKDPVLLSKAEADTMAKLFGTETPDELRAAYAQAVVQALGPNTGLLLGQVEMDPVLRLGAQRQSVGGDPNVTLQALNGQRLLAEGLVMQPTNAATIKEISPEIHAAIAHLPADVQSDVLSFAKAHYASQARGVDPSSDAAKELMRDSINKALGQGKNVRKQITGGVQKIGGHSVLLPVGASAEDVDMALRKALGHGSVSELSRGMWAMSPFGRREDPRRPDEDLWRASGATSVPMIGGAPLDPSAFERGFLALVPHPTARNIYLLQQRIPSLNGITISDIRDANGNAFVFNLPKLIEATR